MAANYQALQSGKPLVGYKSWLSTTTANSKSDGTGTIATDMILLCTFDATYGGRLTKILLSPRASVASTTTTATVARIYISSQAAGATTNANTFLVAEKICRATLADSPTAAITPLEISLNIDVPAGYSVLASMAHAAAASTSWAFIAIAGDYAVVP